MPRDLPRAQAADQTHTPAHELPSNAAPRAASRGMERAWVAGLACVVPMAAIGAMVASRLVFGALPAVPVPPENPITEEKRVLGKILFWDEQLSTTNTVSCGACHMPGRAGADPRIARHPGDDRLLNTPDDVLGSPGVISSNLGNDYQPDAVFGLQPQITDRAANSMINAAFSPRLFWDGRAGGRFSDPQTGRVVILAGGALENQAIAPPLSSVEMAHAGLDWETVASKLRWASPLDLATNIPADVAAVLSSDPTYPQLFARAFGDGEITAARIAMALATYQRTLISDQTPFDRFRAGDPAAMTAQQIRGFNAFNNPNGARCVNCHSTATDEFTNHAFRNIGLRPPTEDLGRQIVTGDPADRGRFKVPGLRNVALKATFMHNGMFTTLTDVLRFYARAPGAPVQFADNRDPIMPQINLPPQAAADIEAFLAQALTDPRVAGETFPFDRPVLFAQRPAVRSTIVAAGTPGSGGIVPRAIAEEPGLLGSTAMRVGLDGALGGSSAVLLISTQAPVGGVLSPEMTVGPVNISGLGAGLGHATARIALTPGDFVPGSAIFVQWLVTDPLGAGGVVRSSVARIPIFCGSSGCATRCDPADVDRSGGVPDINDVVAFFDAFSTGDTEADVDRSGGVPDIADVIAFFDAFNGPC